MKIDKFKERAQKYIDKLDDLIETMPYKGDICSDSQKVCLKQALDELQSNVNGVEEEDFKKLKDE